jgi:drug/metabolite transporter (DMT)-like permease
VIDAGTRRRSLVGLAAAVGAATAYGVTVVIGRSLARDGVAGPPALAVRFGIGAAVLLAVLRLRRRALAPPPGERVPSLVLGAVYAAESSCFFAALGRGTAAAVATIFYSYPAMVAVTELAVGAVRPSAALVAALALSVGGVVTVVATEGDVAVSVSGAVLALAAAASFCLYLVVGSRVAAPTDAAVGAAWVSGTAGLVLAAVAVATLAGPTTWPPAGRLPQLLVYGAANAAAFGLVFVALGRIGATRTAVVLTFEVVASVVLAAAFLGERLAAVQAAGGAAVVAGAVLAVAGRGERA